MLAAIIFEENNMHLKVRTNTRMKSIHSGKEFRGPTGQA